MKILKSILSTLLFTILCLGLATAGGVVGYQKGLSTPQFTVDADATPNRVILEKELIDYQLALAIRQLQRCEYFAVVWTAEYLNLDQIIKNNLIKIAYTPQYNYFFIAAATRDNVLLLTDNWFDLPFEDRVGILVHELLHFAGLPDHKAKLIRSQDAVYVTTAKCMNPGLEIGLAPEDDNCVGENDAACNSLRSGGGK